MTKGIASPLADTIRGRLLLLVAGFVVIASLLAALLVAEFHRNEREIVERQLNETARALSLVVGRQVGQSEALLQALATSPHLLQGDFEAFRRQAESALRGGDRWVVLVDRRGQQLVNTWVPTDQPLPATSTPTEFWDSLDAGTTYVSDLVSSPVTSEPVVAIAVPVGGADGRANGLAVVMPASAMSDVLEDHDFPDEWVASIVDRQGAIVARSRFADRFVGKKATAEVQRAVRSGDRGSFESMTLDGVWALGAFSRAPNAGLAAVVGAPQSALYAEARRLLLLVGAASLLLVLLGVGVSGWVARGVVRSVEALAAGAGALGRGERPAVVPTGLRETDEVADALRDAAARLEARDEDLRRLNEGLEARVRERTAQVQALASTLTMAEQDERRRISQVLHDDLQQILYGAQMKVALLQRGLQAADVERERALAEVGNVDQWLGEAVALTRRLTVDLSPPLLKGAQFRDAIDWLAGQVEEVHGLEVEVRAPERFAVPDEDLRVLLYQITRELLFNAVKHAGAERAVVALRRPTDAVEVEVSDAGRGFDVEAASARREREGGFGLFSVRERLVLFGGQMEIASAPGAGTRVTVRVPVEGGPAGPAVGAPPAVSEPAREA